MYKEFIFNEMYSEECSEIGITYLMIIATICIFALLLGIATYTIRTASSYKKKIQHVLDEKAEQKALKAEPDEEEEENEEKVKQKVEQKVEQKEPEKPKIEEKKII
jgi:hypothetical protein